MEFLQFLRIKKHFSNTDKIRKNICHSNTSASSFYSHFQNDFHLHTSKSNSLMKKVHFKINEKNIRTLSIRR